MNWQFWIDVGGTFTDCIARRPDGVLLRHKLLSSTVDATSGEEAPILAIRHLLGLSNGEMIPPVSVRLGTTRGTNALLERRGARTAFVTTRGFGDILIIGYQNRPRLFALNIQKPEPLYEVAIEIDERIAADGTVLIAPNRDAIRQQLLELKQNGIESLAICLLHAYNHPVHERVVAEIARESGFPEVSVSHQVAPLEKLVARGDTTVVDAYLNPVLRRYVASLAEKLPGSDVRLLTSAGGLIAAEHFSGKDSLFSGPAGGVVGFSRVAKACGFEQAIGFDMGGTSTDVARFDGQYEREFETEKAGVRIVAPMMAIETVAAGGGSICRFDGVKLVVGPESAGAAPGPACYGRGGPLTITDANLILGRIVSERFPFPLDRSAAESRARDIAVEIERTLGRHYELQELAEGFLRVANVSMAAAIRAISIAKGYDPGDYVLVAFGGAAAQHACSIARELGMQQVLVHPDAGLLSAYGAGLADIERHRVFAAYQLLSDATLAKIDTELARMADEARAELIDEGVAEGRIEISQLLDLRYQGTEAHLSIDYPPTGNLEAAFAEEHRRRYGYVQSNRALEVVAARLVACGRTAEPLPASRHSPTLQAVDWNQQLAGGTTRLAVFHGQIWETHVAERSALTPGDTFAGPAIICDPTSTTVIEPGWDAELLSGGELLLTLRKSAGTGPPAESGAFAPNSDHAVPCSPDPIQLEIFNNHFTAIATQMGITLRNTSCSVNVKERLDFSCAIFTSDGSLVANAPHVPVHLGAMGETVRRVIADNPQMQPGDVFVTNDPYRGGSHLPDVTVITPVFEPTTGRRLFFTASRAHHAEIGGMTPGSMPPFSRTLADEGVLIRNFKLIEGGQGRFDALRSLLLNAPYPTRDVNTNLADIAAQVAANQQGARDLLALAERTTLPLLSAYMQFIRQAAEQKMRAALARLPQGRHPFVDHLDDGSPIAVCITVRGDSATFDFTGTGAVLSSNLNANRAIVTAAVMYVLRLVIDEDLPLNEGVLAPVSIVLPECLLNPPVREHPEDCAAVVGGNVETSQRVVDVLLGALKLAAASQGTMNNLLFGDETFGYYETICGGAGATQSAPGADAVHTHMTNTRITDPEVFERRYPVRLWQFAVRRGSGGDGLHRGGDGVVREMEFLLPLSLSILSQRRGPFAPFGMDRGSPGLLGVNHLRRSSGQEELLENAAQAGVQPGDRLTLKTPGGGGWTPFNYGSTRC